MVKEKIQAALEGLYFISETDAALDLVIDPNETIEVRDFHKFFERLTKIENRFGEKEIEQAHRFAALKALLVANLTDLHVVRIGRTDVKIYIVGQDTSGSLVNIKTRAVET